MKQDRFFKNLVPEEKHELPKSVTDFAQALKEGKFDGNNIAVKLPEGHEESEVTLDAHQAFAYLSTIYLHSLVIIQHFESHDEIVPEAEFKRFESLGRMLDDIGPGTTERIKNESMDEDLEIPSYVRENINIFLAIDRESRRLASHRMKPGRIKNKLLQTFKNRLRAYAQIIPPVPPVFQKMIPFNLLEY